MPIGNLLNGLGGVTGLVNPVLNGVGGTVNGVVGGVVGSGTGLLGGSGSSILDNLLSNDLLGGSLIGNITGSVLDLGGMVGAGGLLNLGGLLGKDGILDLNGVISDVLKLLSPDASLDLDDYLDDDGNVDKSKFEKVMIGTDGRDTFSLPEDASTYVDGRGNTDVVNFARSIEGFAFASGSDAVLFVKDDKAYYFENVERVSFFEGQLYLDTGVGENGGMAYRLYQAAFNRAPDNDGVKWWVDALDKGMTGYEAASGFISSNEFNATYGNLNAEAFVSAIYKNVLGRSASDGEVKYWVNEMSAGRQDKAGVLFNFSESAENVALVGQVIENGFTLA